MSDVPPVNFAAAAPPAAAAPAAAAPAADAATPATPAIDPNAEAARINAKVGGWRYQIAGFQYDQMGQPVLKPLNAKLGLQCFQLGASSGAEIAVTFDKACADPAVAEVRTPRHDRPGVQARLINSARSPREISRPLPGWSRIVVNRVGARGMWG